MIPANTFQRYKLVISYKGTNFNGVQRQSYQENNPAKYVGHLSILQVIDVSSLSEILLHNTRSHIIINHFRKQ
jgi:hypothetical protein